MRNNFSQFKANIFAIALLFFAFTTPTFAQDNVVSSVTISKSKDGLSEKEQNNQLKQDEVVKET